MNHRNDIDLKVKVTPVLRKNIQADTRLVLNQGGSGSSKSVSLAQVMINRLTHPEFKNQRILITRKTLPSLKQLSYAQYSLSS